MEKMEFIQKMSDLYSQKEKIWSYDTIESIYNFISYNKEYYENVSLEQISKDFAIYPVNIIHPTRTFKDIVIAIYRNDEYVVLNFRD